MYYRIGKGLIENSKYGNSFIDTLATNLYERQALLDNKITNYTETLPNEIGIKALEMLKDPYIFDITYNEKALEREVEDALVTNITNLLLELGNGFAFVGRQYHFPTKVRLIRKVKQF